MLARPVSSTARVPRGREDKVVIVHFVPWTIIEYASSWRFVEEDAELPATPGMRGKAAGLPSFRLRPVAALASFCLRAFSSTFSTLAPFCLRARASGPALVAAAALGASGAVASIASIATRAAARGASVTIVILVTFFVNATRERRAAVDERPDLLNSHARRPEPMGCSGLVIDDLHGLVESGSLAELDGPIGASGLVGSLDETKIRRVAHGGAAAITDEDEVIAHRLERAPAPLAWDIERSQESVATDEENLQELKVDVVERDVAHQGFGSGDDGNREVSGQLDTFGGFGAGRLAESTHAIDVDDLVVFALVLLVDTTQKMSPQDLEVREREVVALEEREAVGLHDLEIHRTLQLFRSRGFFWVERVGIASLFESFGLTPHLDDASLFGSPDVSRLRFPSETKAGIAESRADVLLIVGEVGQKRTRSKAQSFKAIDDFVMNMLGLEINFERTVHPMRKRRERRSRLERDQNYKKARLLHLQRESSAPVPISWRCRFDT